MSAMIARIVIATGAILLARSGFASEPIVGFWRAVDNGNRLTSIVELYVDDSKLNGRIVSIVDFDGKQLNPVCERCSGELRNKPVVGYPFIRDLKRHDGKWVDGKVVDLRPGIGQGVVAQCEVQLVEGKVQLLGYLFFGLVRGTATWERVAAKVAWAQ